MKNTFLIITSIAKQNHPVLIQYAKESVENNVSFIVIGDTKSPKEFKLSGCDYYSIKRQELLPFKLNEALPFKHYARKNLGYLLAMQQGAEIIIETDDDNFPFESFWDIRKKQVKAHLLTEKGWVNAYKHFTDAHIWPRGFALERIKDEFPELNDKITLNSPIQQGLADENPDVDAIYRFTQPLPIKFMKSDNLGLGLNAFCPFNSQNTTWFKEAFLLLYLPSYCSFRMTDIWRSYIAQRIAWTCGWSVLFHGSTVWQDRNDHNLLNDFNDEISGYANAQRIYESLRDLDLKEGIENIATNMIICYQKFIDLELIDASEMNLLECWIHDVMHINDFE
ncbi:STELLO glycosyltransferase family protein [Yeosuana sp. MJ-SS3]|uniref:STELLO glycosyltransferase family protein n=1 Tax=Gilvirhabdus luticola TaxID=3079858 RepID=A0ABU3U506_9FLAO|nr:STELLO glycosyltransferase family protein [Yeosuana sp. MJ-SS3]MDU8885488.1 STELLO glycosyltransferase family protein [Yeosuana sp. MJ-SS3]